MDESKQPHWAWPHVVGVLLGIAVYFIVYRYTGDSDLFLALASGAGGIVATWAYLRFFVASRIRDSGDPPA